MWDPAPQNKYGPDEVPKDWCEGMFCPICHKETLFGEVERGDDGIDIINYWCDNCERYV